MVGHKITQVMNITTGTDLDKLMQALLLLLHSPILPIVGVHGPLLAISQVEL